MNVPAWINQDITVGEVVAVVEGGCASGAYMPAVTYAVAMETMTDHGDDVIEYLEESCGDMPQFPEGTSWSGIASFYLSAAVELWCYWAATELDGIDIDTKLADIDDE